ncbi:MAG: Na/Pi cotransporter family protein [Clostridiales bacterium]|nr:Na/Pi cotransporter family protein [Clostridiales bacterium]
MAETVIIGLLKLLGGLGVFLTSMKLLTSNVESLAGEKIKGLFSKISKSKLAGVGIGTAATAIIQSSGAITVMVIGFVNSGLMSLTQAATIIYGANIGTTITAQIVALGTLGSGSFDLNLLFGSLAGIGALIILFAKKDWVKKAGGLTAGFGMLFVGLSLMSTAMSDFAKLPEVIDFLSKIQNPVLLVFVGALLTAILQSSSAMTGLIITMCFGGLLSLDQGIFLTFGSNIGTCVVALIAAIGSQVNAKRAALIHLIFNIAGVIVFMLIYPIIFYTSGVTYGMLLEKMFPGVISTQLAMMHTLFNLISVILVLPFSDLLVKLTEKIIPEKKAKDTAVVLADKGVNFIAEQFLSTPPIAVAQVKKEVVYMLKLAMDNFDLAVNAVKTLNLNDRKEFDKREKCIDFLNKELTKYTTKLLNLNISETDRKFLGSVYHTITDIERIGDYAENIFEYAEELKKEGKSFSASACDEIDKLSDNIKSLYDITLRIFSNNNLLLLPDASSYEQAVDTLKEDISQNHIKRMASGECSAETGALFLGLITGAERIADHIYNIAESVKSYANRNIRPAAKMFK